jgi:hypothetical protein
MRQVLIVFAFLFSLTSFAQTKYKSGAIYSDKGAYIIDAPQNWVLDNESGLDQGLHCVLYLKDFNWATSPVIMYGQIESDSGITIKSFVDFAMKEYLKEDPKFEHTLVKTLKAEDKYDCEVYDNHGGPYGSYERVAYIQIEGSVCYVVFSARTKDDFDKYADAIYDVVKSFKNSPEYINGGEGRQLILTPVKGTK